MPYDGLACRAYSAAAQIQARRGSRPFVVIVLPTGLEFVASFFGSLAAGATPSPIAPPTILDDLSVYAQHLAGLLRVARPGLIVTNSDFRSIVAKAARSAGVGAEVHELRLEGAAAIQQTEARAELALLQFTSGSTGRPRGARISFANLQSNIAMLQEWQNVGPQTAVASWLPLHHDMGLIGCMLMPIVSQVDCWIMPPDEFVRNPVRWLECFGTGRATLTASPTFGLAYVNKRVSDDQLQGLDFGSWEGAVIGAERIDAGVMRRFAERLRAHGANTSVLVPAYGLAEATLAVTGVPVGAIPTAARPDWSTFRFGHPVVARARAPIHDAAPVGDGVGWIVSSGRPLEGVNVSIVADGEDLPSGHLGEIVVQGPSIFQGYEADVGVIGPEATEALHTGDAGFLLDDELFVAGRIGDGVTVRGRNLYAEDLEAHMARVPGLSRGRYAVVAGREEHGDALVAIAEREPGDWAASAVDALAAHVGDGIAIRVLSVAAHTIARTSSGKPRRRVIWQQLIEGSLGGEVVARRDPFGSPVNYEPLDARPR